MSAKSKKVWSNIRLGMLIFTTVALLAGGVLLLVLTAPTEQDKQVAVQKYSQALPALQAQYQLDLQGLQNQFRAGTMTPSDYMQSVENLRSRFEGAEDDLWSKVWQAKATSRVEKYVFSWEDLKSDTYSFNEKSGYKNFVYLGPSGYGTATVPLESGARELVRLRAFLEANGIRVLKIGMTTGGNGGFLQEDIPPFAEFDYELTDKFATQQ